MWFERFCIISLEKKKLNNENRTNMNITKCQKTITILKIIRSSAETLRPHKKIQHYQPKFSTFSSQNGLQNLRGHKTTCFSWYEKSQKISCNWSLYLYPL